MTNNAFQDRKREQEQQMLRQLTFKAKSVGFVFPKMIQGHQNWYDYVKFDSSYLDASS